MIVFSLSARAQGITQFRKHKHLAMKQHSRKRFEQSPSSPPLSRNKSFERFSEIGIDDLNPKDCPGKIGILLRSISGYRCKDPPLLDQTADNKGGFLRSGFASKLG